MRHKVREEVAGEPEKVLMFYLEKIEGMDSSPQQLDRVKPLVLELYLVNVDPESPLEILVETLPFNLRKPERWVNEGTYPGSLDRQS